MHFDSNILILSMKQNPETIELPFQLTEQQRQPPEQSLRVISNYSSLERMYNKVNNNKIFGFSNISKKDSLGIAGWVTSARERKEGFSKGYASKSKFATIDYSHVVPSINTMSMGSESVELKCRKLSTKIQQKNRSKTIRGTNFKYTPRHQVSSKFKTVSFVPDQPPMITISRQKKKWQQTFFKEAVKRRMERQMWWPSNPESVPIPPTEYPVMKEGAIGFGGRKREEIRRRFGV